MDILNDIFGIFLNTLNYSAPLIIIALGGLYSERSGVVNIGLEGMATFGAFTSAVAMIAFGSMGVPMVLSMLLGVVFAILGGLLFAALHAYLSINMRVDQIISGTVINILGLALAVFLTNVIYGSKQTSYVNMYPIDILGIPLIIYIIIGLIIASYFLMYKTKWGLELRSAGENPVAARTAGLNVNKIKWQGVLISGALAAIGGYTLVVLASGSFSSTTVAGKGFIALAILILAQWKPISIFFMGLLFGFLMSLGQTVSSIFTNPLPVPVWLMMVLIFVILIINLFIRNKIFKVFSVIFIYLLVSKLLTILFFVVMNIDALQSSIEASGMSTLAFFMINSTAFTSINIGGIFFELLPYILTILSLVIYSKNSQVPEGLGEF